MVRLTSMIDELNARLKDTTERTTTAEQQLKSVSQALVTERQNASQRIKVAKEELTISHANENILRGEVDRLQNVAATSVSQEQYQNAMVSAKQSEWDKEELENLRVRCKESEQHSINMTEKLSISHANETTLRGEVDRLQDVATTSLKQEKYQNALALASQSKLHKEELEHLREMLGESEQQNINITEELVDMNAKHLFVSGIFTKLIPIIKSFYYLFF